MEIPLDAWGLPDEETMSCEDGLVENHYYMDLRGLSKTDFDFAWEAETKILAAVEEGLDLEADEAYDQYIDEMQALWGCDPGVATTVVALSVAGAVPFSSCASYPGTHYKHHPLVACWAPRDLESAILEAARQAGVEVSAAASPGILVWHPSNFEPMREFANLLMKEVTSS
jgi:hypothetical protein